jgi:signal transduction histidine kinase
MGAVGSGFEIYPDRIALGDLYMGSAVVLGHAELLRHLYETVVRHCLEATAAKDDSRITVSAKRCAAVFEVLVHDQGPAITGDEQERLFQPKVTAKRRGLGVGLYLARTAARLHGGEVTWESRPGSGSTFRISLPLIDDDAPMGGCEQPGSDG